MTACGYPEGSREEHRTDTNAGRWKSIGATPSASFPPWVSQESCLLVFAVPGTRRNDVLLSVHLLRACLSLP